MEDFFYKTFLFIRLEIIIYLVYQQEVQCYLANKERTIPETYVAGYILYLQFVVCARHVLPYKHTHTQTLCAAVICSHQMPPRDEPLRYVIFCVCWSSVWRVSLESDVGMCSVAVCLVLHFLYSA